MLLFCAYFIVGVGHQAIPDYKRVSKRAGIGNAVGDGGGR